LESFDTGFFSIQKPEGWPVQVAGQCSTLAFLIRDPEEPLRQIFHFGRVGPVYLSRQQKNLDLQYVNMGGYDIAWIEMPVVEPLTPERFLEVFPQIARTGAARQFMPECPRLTDIQVVSSTPQNSPVQGGRSALLRGVFRQGDRVAEGLFTVHVVPFMPYTGGPGSGTGYGMLFTGITAPQDEFDTLQETLTASVASFRISPEYVQNCLRQQQQAYAGVMRAGETLRETSDMIMRGWEERNKVDDVIAEKRSDAILDKERLYDPDTREVFEFENGFYDEYDINRERYRRTNLQRLPDNDYELWDAATLDGYEHL
jgi:hypothetical protein